MKNTDFTKRIEADLKKLIIRLEKEKEKEKDLYTLEKKLDEEIRKITRKALQEAAGHAGNNHRVKK